MNSDTHVTANLFPARPIENTLHPCSDTLDNSMGGISGAGA
jgi:hypothetical protein